MPNQEPYCGVVIQEIGAHYSENIHVNITVPICLVGMILNLLNVLVFTRKTMNSPPNLILAHLAFVDFLILLTTITKYLMAFIQPKSDYYDRTQSYALTVVYQYSDISIATLQFISAFLTVQLAAWRYIAVVHPLKESGWCNKRITRNVVITGYVVCCVCLAIPYHLSFDIKTWNTNGETKYVATPERHPIMNSITRIIYTLVMKLLLSVVLVGLTARIVALSARKIHPEQLTSSASTRSNIENAVIRQQADRSTAILLAVVALYFIAEFPRGILSLLTMINEDAWFTCYKSLSEIFVTISNINTSITFIAYYILSEQFRTTFKSLFSRGPRTSTSHQTQAPLALDDAKETDSGWETSGV